MKKWLSLLILLVAFIYRDSFTSPFFQDDKILLNLPFLPIANFPYRPISQALFFNVSKQLFGLQPFFFHLVLFFFFAGTVFIIYKLGNILLKDSRKAFISAAFYALNISLFPLFFWTATSYFSIGAFFFFLTLYFFLKKRTILTLITYLLALGSNELAFVLPMFFVILDWRGSIPYLASLPLLLLARLSIGLPQATDYTFSWNFFPTLRWYIFRALNLPEGVQRGNVLIYLPFAVFLAAFFVSLVRKFTPRLVFLSVSFFILGLLPFLFLPGHMSAYYLTMALFGPALLVGDVLTEKRLLVFAGAAYLLLTFYGLEFLAQTHWIILKNTGPIGKF